MPATTENIPPGTRIGNYEIVKELGRGGIGAVYLARHYLLPQKVAIKVHDYFAEDENVLYAFRRSANYLSQLEHPNIVHLYDYGLYQGHAYLAMEYVAGETLEDKIPNNQHKAWLDHCLKYCEELFSAVRYAHNCVYLNMQNQRKRGIHHGDIKPQNILIDRNTDAVKLTDFLMPDVQVYLTQKNPTFQNLRHSTQDFGTAGYMAPEQKMGKVTDRTDIYSVGATLYRLFTGYPPTLMENGVRPRQMNPYLPGWLDNLIVKAMAQERELRFQTIAEIETVFFGATARQLPIQVRELIMGNKSETTVGNISDSSGQIFIGQFNDVVANLDASNQKELAEALKVLKDAILASADLNDDQKRENIEVINELGKEAAKPKPNKTLLSGLSEGLIKTLKAVPDIAKIIATIAPLLPK